MLKPQIFAVMAVAAALYAGALAASFLIYAIDAIDAASKVRPSSVAKYGSPMSEVGIGIGAVLVGLGCVIASIRYLITPRLAEAWQRFQPKSESGNPPQPRQPNGESVRGAGKWVARVAVLFMVSWGLYEIIASNKDDIGSAISSIVRPSLKLGAPVDFDPFASGAEQRAAAEKEVDEFLKTPEGQEWLRDMERIQK